MPSSENDATGRTLLHEVDRPAFAHFSRNNCFVQHPENLCLQNPELKRANTFSMAPPCPDGWSVVQSTDTGEQVPGDTSRLAWSGFMRSTPRAVRQ